MRVYLGEGEIREATKVEECGDLTLVRLDDGREEWMVPAEIVAETPRPLPAEESAESFLRRHSRTISERLATEGRWHE